MGKKNGMFEVLRGISYLTQVGLSLATPIVLCLLGAYWLQERFDTGSWMMLAGLVIGLISGLINLWNFFKFVEKKALRSTDNEAGTQPDDRREKNDRQSGS